jgi:multidrug efflux pump subunit AcrB
MMWLVRVALRRPYTFVCGAILVLIAGLVSIASMAIDIFPDIPIPVVTVVWTFNGMSPNEIAQRVGTVAERAYATTVNDVEHIESQSLTGVTVIKVYFQPSADLPTGVSQLTATSQTLLRGLPTGIEPPIIIRFNATDVPLIQVGVGSQTLPLAEVNDYASNFVRTPLVTIEGATIPYASGGIPQQVNVDLDPVRLYAKGISPSDVSTAVNAQNVILPSGTAKFGPREYQVQLNSSLDVATRLNDIPIKEVNGDIVYLRDVAQVRVGGGVQTNVVRVNGQQGTFLTVLKNGTASSLAIVAQVKAMLPSIIATIPAAIKLQLLADQSVFVKASISGVIREAAIAACLTALMILLFVGSWRSTLIVATSIPLAILCSIITLRALGETLNVMTLGGLALAVGILVDDATVEIENVNRNMAQGKEILQAIMDGAAQIATPAFVSTVSICVVFVPMFFLSGPAASLFRPMAMAVVFAVIASYLLSRTLVPTMVRYLLASEAHRLAEAARHGQGSGAKAETKAEPPARVSRFGRLHNRFEAGFERFRNAYLALLETALQRRRTVLAVAAGFVVLSAVLVPFIGRDFFPTTDSGAFQLHVRAAAGTRVEQTNQLFAEVEKSIRRTIPPGDVSLMLDNIGLSNSAINLATGNAATVSEADGDILVQLSPTRQGNTFDYVRRLRATLPAEFPDATFFFMPADIVNQVLNLGLPAPIDIQIAGQNAKGNYAMARRLASAVDRIPGAVDIRVQQVVDAPAFMYSVDRVKAQQLGLTQRDVASDLLISLSGSAQTAPNFWLDPTNGVTYSIAVMTPQYKINALDQLAHTPVAAPAGTSLQPVSAAGSAAPQLFTNLASGRRQTTPAVVNHYNITPVNDVFLSVDERDLGAVGADVDRVVDSLRPSLAKGSTITVRGQILSMRSSFLGLGLGLLFAILLVYLLLTINFQTWLDPLVIVMALPGALAGILWMLFVTQTTFNVPSLMGAIMAMGVATSNSVLLINFAEDERPEGRTAAEAALGAGRVRLRPVCMTALAMILGMLPMSLGLGEGGEQNAPLGRSVIGGLLVATFFTLVVVPTMYTVIRARPPKPPIVIPEGHA